MDFTKIKCISETCKDKNITMDGAGGKYGGRIEFSKVRCPNCNLVLLIMPIKEFQYEIIATTEQERIEERIKKAKEKSELELAKTITRIKETGF